MSRKAALISTIYASLLFILIVVPALADDKFALVIGNGSYKIAPLPNPVNDANDFSYTLEKLGFNVKK